MCACVCKKSIISLACSFKDPLMYFKISSSVKGTHQINFFTCMSLKTLKNTEIPIDL